MEPDAEVELEPSLPMVTVSGDFAAGVTFVSRTTSALLIGLGELADQPADTLVPYVEVRIDGHRGLGETTQAGAEADQRLFAAVLPLEMAAILIADLSEGFSTACRQLARVGVGELHAEPQRIARAADLIDAAARACARAEDALRHMGGGVSDRR